MRRNKFIWPGILALVTGIGASLCCIAPILALIGGITGVGSTFSFLEPFRPYLAGLTLLFLGFAWYQYWRNQKNKEKACASCGCEQPEKKSRLNLSSFPFLLFVTLFAIGSLTIPWVIGKVGTLSHRSQALPQTVPTATYQFKVKGMTCAGCEAHIRSSVGKIKGVVSVDANYKKGIAIVTMDTTKVTPKQIMKAIETTGYTPLGYERIRSQNRKQ